MNTDRPTPREEKCPTCGGVGGIDSGGMTPWGEGINIPCPSCSPATQPEPAKDFLSPWPNDVDGEPMTRSEPAKMPHCAAPACSGVAINSSGFCERHQPEPAKDEWEEKLKMHLVHHPACKILNTPGLADLMMAGKFPQCSCDYESVANRIVEAVKLQGRFEWCSVGNHNLGGWEIQYRLDDGRHYVYDETGAFVWSGEPKFNAWRCGQMDRELKSLRAELEQAKTENQKLRQIVSDSVQALESGAVSPTASLEFMAEVPKEIRLVVQSYRAKIEGLEKFAEHDDECPAKCLMSRNDPLCRCGLSALLEGRHTVVQGPLASVSK